MAETMSKEEWQALLKKNGDEWRRMLDFEKRLEMEAIDEALAKQATCSSGSPDMAGIMSEEEWLALLKKNAEEWRRMLDFEDNLEMEMLDRLLAKQATCSSGSPDMKKKAAEPEESTMPKVSLEEMRAWNKETARQFQASQDFEDDLLLDLLSGRAKVPDYIRGRSPDTTGTTTTNAQE